MDGEQVQVNLARLDQVIGELAGFDKEIEQQIATLEGAGRRPAHSLGGRSCGQTCSSATGVDQRRPVALRWHQGLA